MAAARGTDYYALQHQRTVALSRAVIGGAPGERATYPAVLFYAGGTGVQDPAATLLGATRSGGGAVPLHLELDGLAPGAPVVLVTHGAALPIPLGAVAADGTLRVSHSVVAPASGSQWWFAVACPAGTTDCGIGEAYDVVTAPIWLTAASPAVAPPAPEGAATAGARAPETGGMAPAAPVGDLVTLPVTGGSGMVPWVAGRAPRRRLAPAEDPLSLGSPRCSSGGIGSTFERRCRMRSRWSGRSTRPA